MKTEKFLFLAIAFLVIFVFLLGFVNSLQIKNFSPDPIQLIYGTKSFNFLIVEDLGLNTTDITASCTTSVGVCNVSCPRNLSMNTNATCTGNITIPQYTYAGIYSGVVEVKGNIQFGEVRANKTFTIKILETYNLSLDFSLKDMEKNQIQNVNVSIKNLGNIKLIINLESWIEDKDGNIVQIKNELNETNFILNPGETKKVNLKIETNNTKSGTYYAFIKANAKNLEYNIEFNKTISKQFRVRFMYCNNIGGEYLRIEIKNKKDFEGKRFKPLESFDVELKIYNDNDEEHDVNIEAALVKDNEIIKDSEISQTITIDKDRYKTLTLNIKIPLVNEGIYELYIKAYDDDNEDECVQEESYIEIKRETRKVVIKNILFDKENYQCGQTMLISGSVVNIGKKDEDLVKIVYNDDLNNNIEISFDLEINEEKNFLFQPKIPLNETEGVHNVTIKIYYDYRESTKSFNKFETYNYNFIIQGGCIKPKKDVDAIIKIDDTLYLNNSYQGEIILRNIGDILTIYEINIDAAWAIYRVDSSIIILNPKEEKIIKIDITPKEKGIKTLILKIRFDNQEKIFTKSITVKEFEEESKYKKAGFIDEILFELKRRPWLFIFILANIIISLICLTLIIILLIKKH